MNDTVQYRRRIVWMCLSVMRPIPTVRELMRLTECNSNSTIHADLAYLARLGYIARPTGSMSRATTVIIPCIPGTLTRTQESAHE